MKNDFLKCIFLNCGGHRDKTELHTDFVVFIVPIFACPLMSPGRKEAENVCARQHLSNKSCCLIKPFFTVRETSTVTVRSIRFSNCYWTNSSSELAYLFSSFSGCVISNRKNVCILQFNLNFQLDFAL